MRFWVPNRREGDAGDAPAEPQCVFGRFGSATRLALP